MTAEDIGDLLLFAGLEPLNPPREAGVTREGDTVIWTYSEPDEPLHGRAYLESYAFPARLLALPDWEVHEWIAKEQERVTGERADKRLARQRAFANATLTKEQVVAAVEVLRASPYWQGPFGSAMLLVPKIIAAAHSSTSKPV